VRRFRTLLGLAFRELWISYRLLALLGLLLIASVPVAVLPDLPGSVLAGLTLERPAWYAIGLAAALGLAAGIAAATLASELRQGRFGWLAVRAVPRTTILLAWFVAFGVVLAIGLTASAILAALSLGEGFLAGRLAAFVAVSAGVGASGLAAVAAGLLIGTFLRPALAAVLTMVMAGGLLVAATMTAPPASPLPVPALTLLAAFDEAARPISEALRAAGTALAIAAGLLVLAAARLERIDL
jgi:hypothetical protein